MRLERTAAGQLIIMAPTGSEGGNYNAEVTVEAGLWNRQTQAGKVFDSSSGFRLPNGAIRAPDVAWVEQSRWDERVLGQRLQTRVADLTRNQNYGNLSFRSPC
jgi:Uma2 family endonuclease